MYQKNDKYLSPCHVLYAYEYDIPENMYQIYLKMSTGLPYD